MTPNEQSNYELVTADLVSQLEDDADLRASYLFLEPHPDFKGFWRVESFDRELFFHLGDVIGPYRAVAPAGLEAFMEVAQECEYRIAFFEDPTVLLADYAALNEPPDVGIHSDLPGTVGGMLPYQVQGFNFLKDLDAGVAMWSTGTGKTVLASALIKFHAQNDSFDLAWFVVKSHNKVNTARTLERLVGTNSIVLDGDKQRRKSLYTHLADVEHPTVVVTNYEKFRFDQDLILPLFEDRRTLCIWDEMPTKLKTRTTQLYKAVCECLYTTKAPQVRRDRVRPLALRQYMLSATPIENDPEDWFNCLRLLDPTVYGTVKDFRDEYVARYSFFDQNKPESWHKLDKMGLKAAHIVHQVDKDDPDIAAQFPEVIYEPYYIDWDEQDRKVYDKFAKELVKDLDDEINVVSAISIMQMLCDAPTMVNDSAARREAFEQAVVTWMDEGGKMPSLDGSAAALRLIEAIGHKLTDERHTKLETLRQLLCEVHPDEKVVLFSAYNEGIQPILSRYLEAWGVEYVRYGGSTQQRQRAQDRFTSDPECRVFLSSDAGSDSINLQVASVCIDYDLPWKWSTLTQRHNRIHRVTSDFETVRFYTLLMADSVEDRKLQVVQQKESYHQGVFKGAIADQSASARMSKEDLLYILKG